MRQILFYLGLIIIPFEWKISTFPSLHSLSYKCCSLTINLVVTLVSNFPCECVKKWKLYLERETDLTWGLSCLLLVILFLPACRDKMKTAFHSHFSSCSKASVPLCSVFSSLHQIRTLKYLIFLLFLFKWEDDTVAIFGISTYLKGKK